MENSFSFRRVILLIRANVHTKWKIYIAGLMILFLIQLLLLFLNDRNIESVPIQSYSILLLVVIAQASGFYPSWNNLGSSFFYLSLPARTSEKYLALLIMTILIFIPIATLAITGSMYLISWLLHGGSGIIAIHRQLSIFLTSEKIRVLGLTLLLLQSVYLYSSVTFHKNSFAFGSVIMFITILVTATIPFIIFKNQIDTEIWSSPVFFSYDKVRFFINSSTGSGSLIRFTDTFRWLDLFVWVLASIGLLTATYFKLKEKEV